MEFPCPHCHTRITADADDGGKSADCPSCGQELNVPLLLVLNRPAQPDEPVRVGPPSLPTPPAPSVTSRPKASEISKSGIWMLALPVILIVIWRGCSHLSSRSGDTASPADSEVLEGGMDLSSACAKGDLKAVRALVGRYDINATGSDGKPLNIAAERGTAEMVKFLISKGARINEPDGWGRFPIHSAAERGNLETLKALVEAGADIEQRSGEAFLDQYNRRARQFHPVHMAARSGRLKMIQYLVSQGADPSAKDVKGETPFNYASVGGRNSTDDTGETCAAVMKYLKSISANCDPAPYIPIH